MLVVEKVEDFDNNTEIYNMGSIREKVLHFSQYNLDILGNMFLNVDLKMKVFDFEMFNLIFFVLNHQFKRQRNDFGFYQVELN